MRATKIDWERAARAALHPTQVEILEALATHGRLSPAQFAKGLSRDELPRIGYHFRALQTLGLVKADGTGPGRRSVQHFYRLR